METVVRDDQVVARRTLSTYTLQVPTMTLFS